MKLFKLVGSEYLAETKVDTDKINYGSGIDYYSEDNKKLIHFYNCVINDSLRAGIPFIDIFRETYHPQSGVEACLFWETLYERVRHEEFPEKLGRLRSYFAFATLEDLDRFKERSHKLHSKVSFEIDDVCVSHVGDMELLDQITAEMNAIEAFQMVRRYWQGERTLLPLLEYLVQGELTLELIN